MRTLKAAKAVAVAASAVGLLAPLVGASAVGAETITFNYTGGEQTLTVPAGVFSVQVIAVGGSGATASPGGSGGAPAQVTGELSVTPSETLYIEVGGTGQKPSGGFNGGGFSSGGSGGGGGGGASDVRTASLSSGLSPDDRLLVAGGGGGGGLSGPGTGGAGGAAEQAGQESSAGNGGGGAGTQSGGGQGGGVPTDRANSCAKGSAGQLGVGGSAGTGNGAIHYGGGGGGGYYGGGGGASSCFNSGGGGGGGSSLVPTGGSVTLLPWGTEPQVQISTAKAPTVVTGAASAVMQTSATLNATVNPNGKEASECKFEYGTTTSYGSNGPCTPPPGSGTTPVAVSASVVGLTKSTTYHFRISATNAGGPSTGTDQEFETPPHLRYYANGGLVGSAPVTIVAWGTLALKKVVGGTGELVCHAVEAGTIGNPVGGGTGLASTQAFATFNCESTTCPFTSVVTAESLPWSSKLEAPQSVVRTPTTGIKVGVDCQRERKSEGRETFVGADAPIFRHGTSALHPGFVEFDAGAGTLEREGSKGGVLAKLEGEVKVLGYDEQELISVN
jgi:hypothetical protein